jgi:hypothetical protein
MLCAGHKLPSRGAHLLQPVGPAGVRNHGEDQASTGSMDGTPVWGGGGIEIFWAF